MALKDKFKHAWKRVADLDDESEAAGKHAGASERIPYKEISKKVKEIMKKNVDVVGRKILIPNYYVIYFCDKDRHMRMDVEDVLCEELQEELYHEMRKINPEQSKRDICIEVKTDPAVGPGEFRVTHRVKKPDGAGNEKPAAKAPPLQSLSKENDFKQTIIEQEPAHSTDDQATIIQAPEAGVLYRVLVDDGEKKEETTVTKPRISIGRYSKDDVVLDSPDFSISREHAVIEVRNDEYYLTPAGINGTFLNGQELELKQEVKVSPDDEIKIMNYTLRILI